ncbi:hypothetical protein LSH36_79g10021 [Paralvinella palmiformis]|uniref:C2H2-type domain-containing protein n=1 Tax=Paralvinella palmiformis TaxID=53620 RepID=A0AAD9K223_9ANNE|nr:hypothetical protein LSH36_79g10021 [Paralvinella palmiformis]
MCCPGDLWCLFLSLQVLLPVYACNICGKRLKSKSSLSVHLKLHEGKYNYTCPLCNKGFSSTYMLKGHMSWHTGVKEFKCTLCPKEYRYSHELKQHVMKKHVLRRDVSSYNSS